MYNLYYNIFMKKLSVVLLFIFIFCSQNVYSEYSIQFLDMENGKIVCKKGNTICNINIYNGDYGAYCTNKDYSMLYPPNYKKDIGISSQERNEYLKSFFNSSYCHKISPKKYICHYDNMPDLTIWMENGKVISAEGRTYNKFKSLQEIYNPNNCKLIYEEKFVKQSKPTVTID